jgi:hypothetical protein
MVSQEPAEAIRVTLAVSSELERLGVTYLVGGSLASSLHGVPRSTNDVDIVAVLREEHAEPLAGALKDRFYVDADMIRDAIARRSTFNVIDLTTLFKIDVFVPLMDIVTRKELQRAQTMVVDREHGSTLRLATAEDTVVQKLRWFALGNQVSERQWTDALGVLVVQRGRLDVAYLRETAQLLEVSDLLEKALLEAEESGRNPTR